MRVRTADNYDYTLTRRDDGLVEVSGSPEAVEALVDTIVLCGSETVPVSGEYKPTGVQLVRDENGPLKCRVAMHEGTVALWLQFEVLNYL